MSGRTVTALPYYGGKVQQGKWIAAQLPVTKAYCEPYAGMLGVLLHRPPVAIEIVNDLNRDIANWWRVVRDDTEALARRVGLTPYSRDHCEEALRVLADGTDDDVRRAWATHVCLMQCVSGMTEAKRMNWARAVSTSVGSPFRQWLPGDFAALANRLNRVQIECCDALTLLERVKDEADFVLYVDPPYVSATRAYKHNEVDVDELTRCLREQKGFVAVSGYGAEWDHLGWRSTETEMVARSSHQTKGTPLTKRTDKLWLNYDPLQPDLLQ